MNSFKGIIFAGCSFTWGQGLHFYSESESLKYPVLGNSFQINHLTNYHLKFIESKRFPRLVSDSLKTVEFVNDRNGGQDKKTIDYWFNSIGTHIHSPFTDYSHLIFQFTEPIRSDFTFELEGTEYTVSPGHSGNINYVEFKKWLEVNEISFESWYRTHIEQIVSYVKEKLVHFETNGIETYVMSWPEEYLFYLKNDSFFSERLISFEYRYVKFESLESLLCIPEMKISTDQKNLKQKVYDDHPSLSCHQIIAESIIKKLTKNDKTKLQYI